MYKKSVRYPSRLRRIRSPLINDLKQEGEVMFTTNEMSKILGLTPNALRIQVHRGNIPALKLGNKLRFRKKEVLSCLSDREA